MFAVQSSNMYTACSFTPITGISKKTGIVIRLDSMMFHYDVNVRNITFIDEGDMLSGQNGKI